MRPIRLPLLAAAFAALAAGCQTGPMYGPYPDRPSPAACRKLADDLEHHALTHVLPAWYPRCVDPAGGFRTDYDHAWRKLPGNPKTMVYQARLTWTAATAAMAWPDRADEMLAHARHGATYLREAMWDGEHGGFRWSLAETVAEPGRHDHHKNMYAHAFGIYALARAARATGDPAIGDFAVEAWRWMEAHAHDPEHGGYSEALARDGRPVALDPQAPPEERLTVLRTFYGGYKSMNAHIHILEALAELYHARPSPELRRRLAEMLAIVRDRIAVRPGCLNQYFTRDWRPLPYGDSFGHDVETAFLILEADEALGDGHEPATLAVARSLVDHALDYGWDAEEGGFYYEGSATDAEFKRYKSWWVQAEGLHVLLMMHELFGRQTPRYWQAALKQWDLIDRKLIDHARGGWRGRIDEQGRPLAGKKASPWKANYHNVRALVGGVTTLRRMAGGG